MPRVHPAITLVLCLLGLLVAPTGWGQGAKSPGEGAPQVAASGESTGSQSLSATGDIRQTLDNANGLTVRQMLSLTWWGALGLITLWFLSAFLVSLSKGESPFIETHWGGLGGGLGGWTISRSMAYLIGAIVFASIMATTFDDVLKTFQPAEKHQSDPCFSAGQSSSTAGTNQVNVASIRSGVPEAYPGKAMQSTRISDPPSDIAAARTAGS